MLAIRGLIRVLTQSALIALVLKLSLFHYCFAQLPQSAPINKKLNIPSQTLDAALVSFSIQADLNVMGLTAELGSYVSPEIKGVMSLKNALELLLENTGLSYQILNNSSVSIFSIESVEEEVVEPIEDEFLLEEVVISATRRSSNLQDTPIAVTALKQEVLNRNKVNDLRDITHIVPGLEVIDTAPQAAVLVQLRGVGSTNITEIADGPVAVHVDGVYSPRSQGVSSLLYDVDRIEVLRGPQGTLFGRNSSSGSINIYNRQANFDEFTVDASLGFGDYQQKIVRTAINVPLADTLAVRIAAASKQHDAYTDLLANYVGLGRHYPGSVDDLSDYQQSLNLAQNGPETADQASWRISALWQASDKLTGTVSLESYRDRGTGVAEWDPTLVDQGIRGIVVDSPTFLKINNDVFRSQFEYKWGNGLTLKYLFGLSKMNRQQIFDADNGRDGSFEQQRTDSSIFKFSSHEIQLLNSDTANLQWLVGAFASREKNKIVFAVDQQNAGGGRFAEGATSWISSDGGAAVSYAVQPDRRVVSLGVFAQAAYSLNDYSRLTLGFRYTKDTKSDRVGRASSCRVSSVLGPYNEPGTVGPGAPDFNRIYSDLETQNAIAAGLPHDNGTYEGIGDQACWIRQVNDFSKTWENNSGLVRYDVDLHEDTLLYTSISTGFKSGHIQDAGNHVTPETVVNYELGLKSKILNNAMRINAALYRADYDDLQFSNQDRLDIDGDGVADTGGSTVVRNASKATIKGLELEFEWSVTGVDHVQLSGTLMEARFDEFEIPDTLFGNLFNPFASPQSTSPEDPVSLSGNSPPRTPDWKFTFSYEHDFILPQGVLTPRISATFSDEYFLDIYNRDTLAGGVFDHLPNGGRDLGVQRAYQLYDVSLRFKSSSKKWMIEGFIKNATDQNTKIASGNFITENGFSAIYRPPRTYGITFSYSWDNS
jgi:iron complex outermembrane receptor protein